MKAEANIWTSSVETAAPGNAVQARLCGSFTRVSDNEVCSNIVVKLKRSGQRMVE